ncbi:MAG: hypothetical protein K0R18_2992 [Bacillales bacterium]|jgi:hypothetical protein|nr:hypothetical protein [Bacillales bacterium]
MDKMTVYDKKDWDAYVKDFTIQLWKERPKRPWVLTYLLLAQFFVIIKNDAILILPIVYVIVLGILFILVLLFWIGYIRQKGSWQTFINKTVSGLKMVIENNKQLSDDELELKIKEFHISVSNGNNTN